MEYDEKIVEEYLNTNEIKFQIELNSYSLTIVELLIQKKIITKEEFEEERKIIKEELKKEVKKYIKKKLENTD